MHAYKIAKSSVRFAIKIKSKSSFFISSRSSNPVVRRPKAWPRIGINEITFSPHLYLWVSCPTAEPDRWSHTESEYDSGAGNRTVAQQKQADAKLKLGGDNKYREPRSMKS